LTVYALDDLTLDLGYRVLFGGDTASHGGEVGVPLNF